MPTKRNKRWWYDFTINKVRYRGPLPSARTKADAREQEDRKRLSVLDGSYFKPQAKTFAEFVSEVFLPWARTNYRQSERSYRSIINTLNRFFGKLPLVDIAPLTVERFKRERLATPTKHGNPRRPASVSRELVMLSRLFGLAREAGLLSSNPARPVKFPLADEPRIRYVSAEEEVQLLAYLDAHNPQVAEIVRVALHTGMRRNEIVFLKWSEVDLARGMIHVQRSKSGRARAIPINDVVRQVFDERWRATQRSEIVFHHNDAYVSIAFHRAVVKLGIEHLHFHDLRHTAATRWADAGVDPYTIAELLGHADIRMTRRYTHALEENKRRAVASTMIAKANVTNLSQVRKEQAR